MSYSSSSYSGYSRFIFLLMGTIFLVVGLGVAIGLGSLPFAGGTMTLMGGIFAVVGIILIIAGLIAGRNAARTIQVLQTGIAGSAHITGLTQTGVFMNENPQIAMNLLIQLPGDVPYAANVKQVVPLMLLGRLSSGAPLSVRVDQMDRSKVVIDWNSTGFAAPAPNMYAAPQQMGAAAMAGQSMAGISGSQMDESLAQVQAAMAGNAGGMPVANTYAQPGQAQYTVEQLRGYLRQSGLQASGHVDQLEDTGQVVGDERVYRMQMTLNIPGQPPQQLPASAAMVPVGVSHKLFQGMTVPVRYAAENHDLLMVEWDRV